MRFHLGVAAAAAALACVVAGTSVAAAANPPTSHYTVRPVTSTGHIVSGWTAIHGAGSIECSATPSPAAVSDNILFCSPSAAFAIACWKGSDGVHALCLSDVGRKQLIRYVVDGSFPHARKPADAVPFRMTLGDGTSCKIRDGGAGSPLMGHPNWVEYYYCSAGLSVWGPVTGDGLNRTQPTWTVQVAPSDGHTAPVTKRVGIATFVGTAA